MTITLKKPSILLLIPARFHSTRLPGKPLVMIEGKSLIQRVLAQAEQCALALRDSGTLVELAVVTDHEKVEAHLRELGQPVVRVDDDVPSGSERLFLAYQRFYKDRNPDFILNIQGDEPLLKPETLTALVNLHQSHNDWEVATLVLPKPSSDPEFHNPNRVKVAFSRVSGQCFYFSRASIPYARDGDHPGLEWFQHIGVYCYRPEALARFCQSPPTALEQVEKLEQLRGLELGLRYGAMTIDYEPLGVDTPEDLAKVEGVLRG